jgi:uncharacterized protein
LNTQRIRIIDILRGFALIGILFANIPGIAHLTFDTNADVQMYRFIGFVFEQRFFPIFSFLFGLGFFIFMRNAEAKGAPANKLIIRRLALLILFGIAHHFLQPGEALLIYGIFGFGLLPLYKHSPGIVFLAGTVMLVLGIITTDYFVTLAMFYFGMFIGKIGFFENPEKYRRQVQTLWAFSLLAIGPSLWAQQHYLTTNNFFTWQSIAGLFIATAFTTSILLWRKSENYLNFLAAYGRTALTNYILQSVIVWLIALALGGRGSVSYQAVPWIWLSIFPVQVIISNLWMRRFNYGPLEWLWRWGTYGRKPLFVKP